ncbi:MAG: NAD-dependent epimerase/dehydratase family protein [Acidimicrobiales bacterium]
MGRRVLITGVDKFWGGRMAQALEQDPDFDVILGMGTKEPQVALERAEFVRSDQAYSILSRIVRATHVDTIIHTFVITNTSETSSRILHDTNVIGTMNLLAAAGQRGSMVRQVVVKSSSTVYGATEHDPAWFREETPRSKPARSRLERSLIDVEQLVKDFAEDNPATVVSMVRCANVLGSEIVTPLSTNLAGTFAPVIDGFDPLLQFVHESDVVGCLLHLTRKRIPGLYNLAGDERIPWSEVLDICRAKAMHLPAYGTMNVASLLVRLGFISFTPELEPLLRYGRGVDTTRIKRTGFEPHYTTAGTVRSFIKAVRLKRNIGKEPPSYTFEQDIEQFFRHSPAVIRH